MTQPNYFHVHRWFIPTGFQSKELIVKAGLNLGDVDQFPRLDITLDGADEVDADLNAIKGGGACHLREKVLAEAADKFILVADARKDSALLGTNWRAGVPIEVVPFAWAKVMSNIQLMGCPHPVRSPSSSSLFFSLLTRLVIIHRLSEWASLKQVQWSPITGKNGH
jgi:ribose 5-phosphate isomerase